MSKATEPVRLYKGYVTERIVEMVIDFKKHLRDENRYKIDPQRPDITQVPISIVLYRQKMPKDSIVYQYSIDGRRGKKSSKIIEDLLDPMTAAAMKVVKETWKCS